MSQESLAAQLAAEAVIEMAFQSYIGVVPTPPKSLTYDNFSREINRYMQLPPFQFHNPFSDIGGLKRVSKLYKYI